MNHEPATKSSTPRRIGVGLGAVLVLIAAASVAHDPRPTPAPTPSDRPSHDTTTVDERLQTSDHD